MVQERKINIENLMKSKLVVLNIKYNDDFGCDMATTLNGDAIAVNPNIYRKTNIKYQEKEVYVVR